MRGVSIGVLVTLVVAACSSAASPPSPGVALIASWQQLGISCGQPVVGVPDNMPQWICQATIRGLPMTVDVEADDSSVAALVAQVPAGTDPAAASSVFEDLASNMSAVANARAQIVDWIGQWNGATSQVSMNFAGGRAAIESDPTWITLDVSRVPFASATAAPTVDGASTPTPLASSVLDSGLPTNIDGQPVLRGDDLRAAIADSADDTPFLAGGWLQSKVIVRACPAEPVNPSEAHEAVNMCGSFGLYDQPDNGVVIWVAPGDPGLLTSDMFGVVRPVVLQLHTNDSRCDFDGCAQEPVLSRVAWLGDTGWVGVSLAPHPTRPPTGITQDQAIAKAFAEANFPADSTVRSVAVELQTEAVPNEWPLEVDPWVWMIVADSPSRQSALVLLGYETGAFIESELPAPTT